MARVTLEQVGKTYPGGVEAVRAVDLEISDGEFVVLVGPSGCGKSTLLRMIAGLESPSQGTVAIGERTVNDLAAKDRDVAMVFQNYALYPHMTVYANMAFALKLRGVDKREIDQRVREAAQLLQLEELLARKPKALSGGQRQRVALGRSIVRNPAVFLFDEPLSNLDAKLRVHMRVEIAQLHSRLKSTMIYVTHDQVEAMTLGQRLVLLKDGVVQQIDPPLTMYQHPTNRFVAGFLGTPPMNFVEGQLAANDQGEVTFEAHGMRVCLEGVPAVKQAATKQRQVTLGIRPEHLRIVSNSAIADQSHFRAVVELVEPMGYEQYVYLRIGDADTGASSVLVCRETAQQRIEVGESIDVAIDLEQLHFFETGGSGARIA